MIKNFNEFVNESASTQDEATKEDLEDVIVGEPNILVDDVEMFDKIIDVVSYELKRG